MLKTMCNNCLYYRQHYVLDDHHIFRVHCGHCTFYESKRKKPDSKECENCTPSDPYEEPFATKEYLSKALLEYVLRLELLPQIHELEQEGKTIEK